jgi:ribosomal protein S18 acetylase RimI-like enzyme
VCAASKLLKQVLDVVSADKDVIEVYLNVQTSNEDARQFYVSPGFTQTDMIPNYYKRIEPPDCFVFKKSLQEGHQVCSTQFAASAGATKVVEDEEQ